MTETTPQSRALFALALVILLGAGLRLSGLDYGIPHPTARPDEERLVGRAQTIFATGDWRPGSYFYPSLVFYAQAAALELYYAAGVAAGRYDEPFDFLFDVAVTRPGLHYRIARLVSVASGLATLLAVYALGASAYGKRSVGLLAALFVAVAHLHVRDSHFATVDVPMTLFVTLALLFAVRAAARPTISSFVLAGLATGLAISSKYNAVVVSLPVLVAWLLARPPRSRLALAGASATLGFAVTSPYVVLQLGAFLGDMDTLSRFLYGDARGELALWTHLRTTLPDGLGWPLLLLALFGAGRASLRRSRADLVLLSFLVPFFVLIASVRVTFPRYAVPLVPVFAVLAAEAAAAALDRVRKLRPLALSAAIALLAGPTLASSVAFDRIASRADTRLQAADFIGETTAPQTRILVCEGYGAPAINEDRRRPPAYVVEPLDCLSEPRLPIEGASLLVTHEHEELSSFSRIHPGLARWLEDHATLLRRFDPYRLRSAETPVFYGADAFYIPYAGLDAVERGGPIVSVWRLNGGAQTP